MEYTLKTFKKTQKKSTLQKRFNIFFGVMMIIFIFIYFISFDNEILWFVLGLIWLIFCFIFWGLKLTSFVRKEPLLGRFDGEIIFKTDLINVKGQEINLDEIVKIEIYDDDYKGKSLYKGRYNVDGCLSQGVGNLLFVKMKSGKEVEVNFLQTKENQIREMEPLLIHYCQKGIIHRLHFISVLGLGYDKIQVYKKKYGI